jgi:hypothetical protein
VRSCKKRMTPDEVQELVASSSGPAPPLQGSENSTAVVVCSPRFSAVTPIGTGQHALYGPPADHARREHRRAVRSRESVH